MQCANCGTDNESGHKFCRECGSALAAVCVNGHSNPPGHKFCFECGAALAESARTGEPAPAPDSEGVSVEERRLVTSLFVDLVGFTPFSETRDPEEVRAILTQYFDRARDIIDRFGGVVDKFIGDAVTAFWGIGTANEDDAERAVRAALELVDSVSELGSEIGVPDLALRAGVLTGETSVGPGGNATGLVLGDVVNTASRLQSIAAPGTVAVGEATVRLTEGAVDYEPLGDQDLKGKSAPVPAWRAVRVSAARGGRGRSQGLEPPFVGRQDEMRLLKDGLEATRREGRARLISIVGQGGIGKTRLGYEFWKYIDGLVDVVYWHQGRSPSYGQGLTFWALGEMVRQRAGIAETDDDHKSRTKLRTAVAEYVSDVDEQRWIEPRLAGLLGLAEMPDDDRTELYAALSTFFQRISERGTTVLLFEDLHWADPGLLTFIDQLVERSHRHPILIVTLSRPELIDREPSWGAARKNTLSSHLGHLADVDVRALIDGVVVDMPEAAATRLVERASGVPLYAVEMLRMLLTQGDIVEITTGKYRMSGEVTTLAIPDTLQAVIGARIDRLAAEERDLLQDGAVLGQSFTPESLAALSGDAPQRVAERLDALARRELLRLETDPRSPERGQYRFVQSLIREVAYGRLTHAERRARHLKAAAHHEDQGGPEVAAVVANHYMAAYHASPEGGEADALATKATSSLRSAAQRAADLHSNQQVLDICEEALSLGDTGSAQAELLELAANAANALLREEEAVDYAQRAVAWQDEHGDEPGRVRAATLLGQVYTDFFHPSAAIDVLRPMFDRYPAPESKEELRLGAALVRALMLSDNHEETLAVSEQVLIPAEAQEDASVVVETMITRGTSLATLGRLQEGIALLNRALELAEQNDLPLSALRAHNNLSVLLIMDDRQADLANARAAYEKAHALGDPAYLVRTSVAVSVGLVEEGRYEEAVQVIEDLEVGEDSPYGRWLGWQTARIAMARGHDDADETARRAHAAIAEFQDEPQQRYLNETIRAFMELFLSGPEAAFDVAMNAPYPFGYPWHFRAAAVSAVLLQDPVRIEAVRDGLAKNPTVGRRVRTLEGLIDAAIAELEGRHDEAAALLGEILDLETKIEARAQRTENQALAALILGLDDPLGREAGTAAKDWFGSIGAVGYLAVFADALPDDTEQDEAATA